MRLHKAILSSKVARRIFLLFFVCSVFPVAVLTAVSSRIMSAHLEDQGQRQLQQTTKTIGMVILGRLSLVESELRSVAILDLHNSSTYQTIAWDRMIEHLATRVKCMALVGRAGVVPLFGDTSALPAFTRASAATHPPGDVALAQVIGDADHGRVFLRLALDVATGPQGYLIAEVAPEYLWNIDGEIELPWDTELLVLDSEGEILLTSFERTDLPASSFLRDRTGVHGRFHWLAGDRAHQGHSWPIFLESRYGCPGWTVLVTQPVSGAMTSLAWASKILPLAILLCLLVVAFLSLIQIRKSLIPIVSLQQGTKQIAEGRFDARVTVTSKDEFAQLAESFNGMADRLGAQFRTLKTLAEIDRELLSTLDEKKIVETLLLRAPDRFRCDRAAVVIADAVETGDATIHVHGKSGAEDSTTRLTPELRRRMLGGADGPVALPPTALPPAVAGALGPGLAEYLLLPVLRDGITGCLVLGFRRRETWTNEVLTEARRLASQAGVALSNSRLLQQLERVNRETLYALARAVDANSPWTAGHSERVTGLALELARRLGLDDDELAVLRRGGLLHDIGKIGVPGHVVDKPDRLTEKELTLMQEHVRIGARILEPISGYRREIPIVLHHHERYDGNGYPDGLVGHEIPYLARVLAVADVFDALVSDRPYRPGWELLRVVEHVKGAAGTHFDPGVVEIFLELVEDGTAHPYLPGEEPCILPDVRSGEQPPAFARS